MTIDDESSVYVGGLPYDATEDSVRQVFDLYGAVVAVKIVNDNTSRGKCYGFVTFRNPRSAIDAINDMDGRTVDGRVVRVNEVRTRGGRLGFGRGRERESFRRDVERGRNWGRGREHEMEYDDVRERYRERYSDRSMEPGEKYIVRSRERRSVEYEGEIDGGYDRVHGDHEVMSEHFSDRERVRDRDLEDIEQGHRRSHERGWGRRNRTVESDREREMDRTELPNDIVEKDRDQQSRRWNGSNSVDRNSRELLSHSSDDFNDQVKEQLERSTLRLEELKKETSEMEERLEDEGKLVLDLQNQSKKLEDALVNAKKNTSHQKMQLTKLHDCFMQVKDYRERLKRSEDELQMLVETATGEDGIDDVGLRDTILTIGNA
ncbi:glycine-rich RNA-binding protein RZ1B [Rosa sericea]